MTHAPYDWVEAHERWMRMLAAVRWQNFKFWMAANGCPIDDKETIMPKCKPKPKGK